MIIVVFELSNVILTTREENTSISVEFVILVKAFVDLIIIENFTTNSIQKITSFLELTNVNFIWEINFLKLKLPFFDSEVLLTVINDVLNRQWFEFFPIFNGFCGMLWVYFWERAEHVA